MHQPAVEADCSSLCPLVLAGCRVAKGAIAGAVFLRNDFGKAL
ncbi:MAG: hypothetical protein ACFB0E_15730 [Leptolyngbyaceae cyanobacterium]